MHLVFHVSQLKSLEEQVVAATMLPPMNQHGILQPEPTKVLTRRVPLMHNQPVVELLVKWRGQRNEDATWENYHKLNTTFPHLVNKVF